MSFPTDLDSFLDPTSDEYLGSASGIGVVALLTNIHSAVEALEAKVGKDSSAVTTSHDYKLSGVTGTDKAVSKTGTETLTNKTLSTGSTVDADVTVTEVLKKVYPVGSIYTNATDSTNPATLLGFGTWSAFGAGRVMVGLNSDDTDFDTVEETGGEKTVTLTAAQSGLPSHTHNAARTGSGSYGIKSDPVFGVTDPAATTSNASAPASESHTNLQPYIVVRMWKRTA